MGQPGGLIGFESAPPALFGPSSLRIRKRPTATRQSRTRCIVPLAAVLRTYRAATALAVLWKSGVKPGRGRKAAALQRKNGTAWS